jgi:hypothetical protein
VSELFKVEHAKLSRVFINSTQRIPRLTVLLSRANLQTAIEAGTGDMVLFLDTYMHGIGEERIVIDREWPADWWQAFRERWFPKWWLKCWPVLHKSLHINEAKYAAVCPHIHDDGRDQQKHIRWMVMPKGIGV